MLTRPCAAILGAAFFLSTPVFADEATNVTIVSPREVSSYDLTVAGFAIQSLEIMENLVDADQTGALRPGLATDWRVSDDGLTWSFELRDGVRCHDDTPFDATAAARALQRAWQQPRVLAKVAITAIAPGLNGVIIDPLQRSSPRADGRRTEHLDRDRAGGLRGGRA